MEVLKELNAQLIKQMSKPKTIFCDLDGTLVKHPVDVTKITNPEYELEVLPGVKEFLYNIDAIYIGHFNEMEVKHVNAFYQDGTIYVSNVQDDEADMIDDIIHEIAHAVEEQYGMQLYSDGEIEKEFMIKRHKLENILKYHEFETKGLDFQNLKFNPAFDELLHIKIGYPTLSTLSSGLFYSPYGITSLREYFSEIFEAFFNKREWSALRKISPAVINKIDQLLEKE